MLFRNPFERLNKLEWLLWVTSIVIIAGSFLVSGSSYLLSLVASLVGVTALVFVAKGDVWGQFLTIVFSLLYAVVSFRFRYFGEMITYLCMTAPIAGLSVVSWLRNPYAGTTEVKVHLLTQRQIMHMVGLTIAVTVAFYFVLAALGTTNILISTVSISTSFLASYLMLYRCASYALAYAANDIVLVVLWVLATMDDLSYLPMVACFSVFLLNDIYGYLSWTKMKKRQQAS